MRLAAWGSDLLDLLLPAGCVACRAWIPGGRSAPLVCARCRTRLRVPPWPRCERCDHPRASRRVAAETCSECAEWASAVTAARSAYVLEPPADDLVHALKYEDWPELAEPMGDAVARLADGIATDGRSIVVPVPTTAERLRTRRYNQAELLARRVAAVCDLPLRHPLVRRVGGRSQTALTPAERRRNVQGVFAPRAGAASTVEAAHVLLVDDVLTTGATASEAASVLAQAGARSVRLLTFARALATGPEKFR